MRSTLLTALALLLACAACHKNDVDVAELTTNPFDADYTGPRDWFEVDTITTENTNQFVLFEQHAIIRVHTERFTAPMADRYEVRMVEQTVPETKVYPGAGSTVVCENYNVSLGTTYCYRFELHVNGQVMQTIEQCALAEL
jgi:hypothetical protein